MARHHLIDGVKVPFTAEEETAWDVKEKAWADGALDRALVALRDKRNSLLTETDWWGAADLTMTNEQKNYRQALRDLPSNYTTDDSKTLAEDLSNLNWPTKP